MADVGGMPDIASHTHTPVSRWDPPLFQAQFAQDGKDGRLSCALSKAVDARPGMLSFLPSLWEVRS